MGGMMIWDIGLGHVLALSAVMFVIGMIGVLVRRNVLIIFMSIEMMLNSANLAFIAFAWNLGDMTGHIFVFMVMVVAAAVVAVGLAIVLALFRNRDTLNVDEINIMKW
jgi:NADH-quinone oxidoreductase subunit K